MRPYRIASFAVVALLGLAIGGWLGLVIGGIVWLAFRLLMRARPWLPSQG